MTLLTYTLITDPAPLEASAPGRSPSTGTVYLVVTNTGQQAAFWSTIKVEVPVGNGAGDLTSDFNKIKPKGEYGARSGPRSPANVQPGPQGSNAFQATAPGGRASFAPGDHMVLTLENVTVAPTAGLAVLRVTENTGRTKTGLLSNSFAAVALVKTAPKEIPAPRNFRPDDTMVNAGTSIVLKWEGSDDFDYKILFPGGQAAITQGAYSWSPAAADAPKRATTYTLVATSRTTPQQQHFLTATVQVRNPVLETLIATTGIDTPWIQGTANATRGRVTFTGAGVAISNGSGGQGTVTADNAYFNTVYTPWIGGPNGGEGAVAFSQGGATVRRAGGSQERGTLFADKADLNGVNTRWVQGRSADDGWISFPHFGIQVSRGGTDSAQQGVVYTENVYAKDGVGSGSINLHDSGITVYSPNGRNGIGSVTARIDAQ
ncbi:hypothetical protein DQ384_22340 [Sphaerisporangium album]|uniref:Uncharacterized protein n=1 Tax=Sphaerisporangium album TaxID=509200 RepID=A0A367FGP1_9ACTN|nr:hypothetical protein [Sphaerisporangium album]RCG29079.1 hypothetical protein DQ384_22340 [Sphaerisporangium album]